MAAAHDVNGRVLDQPAVFAVRIVMRQLCERVDATWRTHLQADASERGPGGDAEEALHDFRVAVRTLRSWARSHQDLLDLPRRTRRRLKRIAQATNPMRDAEVLDQTLAALDGISERGRVASRHVVGRAQVAATDEAERLHSKLLRDVQRALPEVMRHIVGVRLSSNPVEPWRFPTLAQELADRLPRRAAALGELLRQLTAEGEPAALHRTRLAAKRVRYLIEPVASEVPEAKPALKELKMLQDVLGGLNDLSNAQIQLVGAAVERSADEGAARAREIIAAATEGRAPARRESVLSGFAAVARVLSERRQEVFADFEGRFQLDGARALFVGIERLVAALAGSGDAAASDDRPGVSNVAAPLDPLSPVEPAE